MLELNTFCCFCTSDSTAGAVAEILDISCLYGTSEFGKIPTYALDAYNSLPTSVTIFDVISELEGSPYVLGQHYFIKNPTSGALTPKWDFTSAAFAGNADAYVVGAKVGDLPSPTSTSDIDWLALNDASGDLATQVFRIVTDGGQPPASVSHIMPNINVNVILMTCTVHAWV